jgi:hypothetical protein
MENQTKTQKSPRLSATTEIEKRTAETSWSAFLFLATVAGLFLSEVIFSTIALQKPWFSITDADKAFYLIMQAVVTIAAGGIAGYIILKRKYAARDKHWAYATLGTLLGYWLHNR